MVPAALSEGVQHMYYLTSCSQSDVRAHPDRELEDVIYVLYDSQTAAFQQFLNASQYGHTAALVEVAWYSSTGNLEGVSQDVQRAVM